MVLKYGLAVLGPACGDSVGGQEVKDVARQATWIYAEVANGSCRSLVEKVLLNHPELSQPPKATIIGIKLGQHPKRKPQKPAIFKGCRRPWHPSPPPGFEQLVAKPRLSWAWDPLKMPSVAMQRRESTALNEPKAQQLPAAPQKKTPDFSQSSANQRPVIFLACHETPAGPRDSATSNNPQIVDKLPMLTELQRDL